MRFTLTRKVVVTGAAALGVVLGAAGITAAATTPGSSPAHEQMSADQDHDRYTPAAEQGKSDAPDADGQG